MMTAVLRYPVILSCVLLSACSAGVQDTLSDYEARLARSLQVSAAEVVSDPTLSPQLSPQLSSQLSSHLAPLPGRRELALDEPELSIDMLDFLALSSCELGRVLGAGNSSLGKLAQPSQRMHYQRDVLLSAPACLQQLESDDPELASELSQLLDMKYDARMRYWWNAWFASDEWRAFQSGSEGLLPLPGTDESTLLAAQQALDYLLRQGESWQAGELAYSSSEMEAQQQQLLATAALGRWRLSNKALAQLSLRSAGLLSLRLSERPLCPAGRKTPQADIVQTVFHKYYAGVIQPYLSATDRFGAQMLDTLLAIGTLSDGLSPEGWQDLMNQLVEERRQMLAAHQQHVLAWQAILAQCGMMPGSQSSTGGSE